MSFFYYQKLFLSSKTFSIIKNFFYYQKLFLLSKTFSINKNLKTWSLAWSILTPGLTLRSVLKLGLRFYRFSPLAQNCNFSIIKNFYLIFSVSNENFERSWIGPDALAVHLLHREGGFRRFGEFDVGDSLKKIRQNNSLCGKYWPMFLESNIGTDYEVFNEIRENLFCFQKLKY